MVKLLLGLFVHGVLATPIAEFLKLNLALYELFVLASPIIDAFATLATEFNKLIL